MAYTKYIIVQSVDYAIFNENVRHELSEGWELIGGINIILGKFNNDSEPDEKGKFQLLFTQALAS